VRVALWGGGKGDLNTIVSTTIICDSNVVAMHDVKIVNIDSSRPVCDWVELTTNDGAED
jgi:hypothetical protein